MLPNNLNDIFLTSALLILLAELAVAVLLISFWRKLQTQQRHYLELISQFLP